MQSIRIHFGAFVYINMYINLYLIKVDKTYNKKDT